MATRPDPSSRPPPKVVHVTFPTGQAPRKRKPAPSPLTPKQRKVALASALVLILAGAGGLFVPLSCSGPESEESEPVAAESGPPQTPAPATAPQTVQPSPGVSWPVPSGSTTELPPLQDVISGTPRTPQEINARIETLAGYATQPAAKERQAAYQELLKLGPELVARLPKLIETGEGAALDRYADAAQELKVADAVPALIARLEGKEKPAPPHELFKALAALDDPKARAYVLASLQGKTAVTLDVAWGTVGAGMDDPQLECALQTVSSGRPDCLMAAQALGRYGVAPEKARALTLRLQPLLSAKQGQAKLAIVRALAAMDPMAAGSTLMSSAMDFDPQVRAAALAGLARSPMYANMVLNSLRSERDPTSRMACAQALANNPSDELLPEFVDMLKDSQLSEVGHRALVRANQGRDLGVHEFVWREWLAQKSGKPEPLEVQPLEDAPGLETPLR